MVLEKPGKEKFVLVFLTGSKYEECIPHFLDAFLKTYKKICFVSSSLTWEMLRDSSKKTGLDISKIIFVDTLSSYYSHKEDLQNCLFVKSPFDFGLLSKAIHNAIIEKDCKAILFDSVSDFWSQEYVMNLFRFLNSFLTEKHLLDKTKWVYFVKQVIPEDYEARTIDFAMLADKVIYLNNSHNGQIL